MAVLRDTAGVIIRDTAGLPIYDTAGVDTTLGAIPPDAILASTNLTGAVTDIQDDPDASPATGWLTATDPLAATDVRVSFPTPGAA